MRLVASRGCRRITTVASHGMKPPRRRRVARVRRWLPLVSFELADWLRGYPK